MHLNFVMCSIDSMHFTATDPQHTSYVSIRYKACRTQTNELTAIHVLRCLNRRILLSDRKITVRALIKIVTNIKD